MSTPSQLRVLYVVPGRYSEERRNYNQLQRVLYVPSDVELTLLVARHTRIEVPLPENVRLHRAVVPGRAGFYLAELLLLARARRRTDAVVTAHTFEAVPAWVFRRSGRYTWVADIWDVPHSALTTLHASARGVRAAMRRLAARVKVALFERAVPTADLVVASVHPDGLARYGIAPARMRCFPNAIAQDQFQSGEDERVPASICYVSSLFLPDRGIDTLADAVARLGETGAQRPHVVLAGSLSASVKRDLESHPATDAFRLLGSVGLTTAHRLMRTSEVGVLPLQRNDDLAFRYPVKLLEYMAHGCVVVASDLPGIRGIVRAGRDGLLVPPGDPDALADALRTVFADEELRTRLREGAAERVRLYGAQEKVSAIYAEMRRAAVA